SGEIDIPTAAVKINSEPNVLGSAAGPAPGFPHLFAVVEGVKNGEPIRVGAQPLVMPNKNMGEMTGIPLAVATAMMVRGEVDHPGVSGPEVAVDPKRFFDTLATFADEPAGGPSFEVLVEPMSTEALAKA
ncbi:MAG TPA: hypothetical protein VEB65_03315, partial [Solirubrobacterales bacterium]|nr:hypothetical protein [Solirubrobacterales bacterium]